jgi:hypothetical protein
MDALDAGYHGVLVELDAVSTRFADLLIILDVAGIQKDIESVSKQSRDQMVMLGRLKCFIEDLNAEIDSLHEKNKILEAETKPLHSLRKRNKFLEAENKLLHNANNLISLQEGEEEGEYEDAEEEGEDEDAEEEGEDEDAEEEGEDEDAEEEGVLREEFVSEGEGVLRAEIINEILDQIAENVFLNADNPEPRFTSGHNKNGQKLNMKNFEKLVNNFVSHRDHEPIIFQPTSKFRIPMKTHPLWDMAGLSTDYKHAARKFMQEMPTASWNDTVPVSASPSSSPPSSMGY